MKKLMIRIPCPWPYLFEADGIKGGLRNDIPGGCAGVKLFVPFPFGDGRYIMIP
jgi:hypothetical protein